MEILIEILLGRIIIRFFGVYTRFAFFYLIGKKRNIKSLYGRDSDDLQNSHSQDFWNVIIDFIMFGFSFFIVYLFFS